MKEATGEANMTVITIVLITIVAAIATPLIRNMLIGTAERSCCTTYGGNWENGVCSISNKSIQDCVEEAKKSGKQ